METSKYVEMLISDANMLCSEFGRPDRWAECFCLAMLKEMLNEYRPNRCILIFLAKKNGCYACCKILLT